jgi:hypothetical protein
MLNYLNSQTKDERHIMAVNADKTARWKADVLQSVDMYNDWFMVFAPKAYRDTRVRTAIDVENALKWTSNLTNIQPHLLRQYPGILSMLRMTTAPPIARDRLSGLAGVSRNLIETMEEEKRLPPRMTYSTAEQDLQKMGKIIERLADGDLFPWLEDKHIPNEKELYRAATVVADRLCGASTNPIIRNAQEQRQLKMISDWLDKRGYTQIPAGVDFALDSMKPGTYSFRRNIPVEQEDHRIVNMPVDAIIMPLNSKIGAFPLLIEAKSAGDFANTNKRRKEEATKLTQLKRTYGSKVSFILFLCGYFDAGYLGYEASEGIDWVWEHRIEDFIEFGV